MAISGTAREKIRGVARDALARHLAKRWRLMLLRGVVAVLFGIAAMAVPGATLESLILVWAVYAFADGSFSLWSAATGEVSEGTSRWWLAASGVAGVAAGILAWLWPGATAMAMLLIIASWAILTGAMQILGAIKLRKEIEGEWLLGLSGLLSILLGAVLLLQPQAGAAIVVFLIGAFSLLGGVTLIALALRLRKLAVLDD